MTTFVQFRRRGYARTLIGTLFVLAYLFPVYWMIATSLKTSGAIFASPPQVVPVPLVFSAYIDAVINNPLTIRAILNSAIIGIGTMLMTLLLPITQLLPAIVIATPLFVLFSRIGLLNSYPALILADTTITLPFAVIIMRPFFLTVPSELEAAAKIDGCNQFSAFWRVVLPLVRPGLITVAVFAFLFSWGEFLFALSLKTSENVQPVTVALNKFIGQYGVQWNKLMAVATTIALPIILIFASLQRYIVGGLVAGSVKE